MTLEEFMANSAPKQVTVYLSSGIPGHSVQAVFRGPAEKPELLCYFNHMIERALHTARDRYLVYISEKTAICPLNSPDTEQLSMFR